VDRLAKLEEEENNPMKVLENKTVDSKREMDILDALQDIRARNARNERVGLSEGLLAKIGLEETEDDTERKRLEEEDERLVQEVFSKVSTSGNSVVTVKRKADDHESPLHNLLSESTRSLIASHSSLVPAAKKRKPAGKNLLGIKVVKKSLNPSKS
jgi:Saf4/Yju2 protein